MRYEQETWMGAKVPPNLAAIWTSRAAHHWRTGVLDALRSVARDHDITEMVVREAAKERIDRARRAGHGIR